jgi:hypothetical protein
MGDIPESDWKKLRKLVPLALERFCERVLSELAVLVADSNKGWHERYLAVFALLKRRNSELAKCFDDMRRSTAFLQLAAIQSRDLLTEKELNQFSPETRAEIEAMLEAWRR